MSRIKSSEGSDVALSNVGWITAKAVIAAYDGSNDSGCSAKILAMVFVMVV